MSIRLEKNHAGFYTGEEVSPEIRAGIQIPPAEGEERKRLLLANETLLLPSSEFTPENLATLMSNMVKLLGAQESRGSKGMMNTPYLVDNEHDRAIQFWGHGLEKGDGRPHAWIRPRWAALPEVERQAASNALTEPYMIESLGFTYLDLDRGLTYPLGSFGGRNELVVEVRHSLCYPTGYIAPEYPSYVTGKDAKIENWRSTTSPLARESLVLATKPLGQRLWNAFIETNTPSREVENATQEVLIDTSSY